MGSPITKDYLTAYFDAFSNSDFETMASYYHDDIVLTFPGRVMGGKFTGKETLKEMFQGVQDMFQKTLKFHCTWATVDGNMGVVQWYTEGQLAGKTYLNRGCVIWTFEGDKIVDFQDYIDTDIISAFLPGPPPDDIEDITAKAFHPLYA